MGQLDSLNLERFYQRIQKDDCWLWTGFVTRDGYGQFFEVPKGRSFFAHRLSWELHNGPIPDGKKVKFWCSNRHCVNPDHLYVETSDDIDSRRDNALENGYNYPNDIGLDSRNIRRFESKIDKSGDCWIYMGGGNPNGYGAFWINDIKQNMGAHVVSYRLYKGAIDDGLFVCHNCDNRRCVNPDHFFLGTTQDNMDDMKFKGRQSLGETNNKAKLVPDDILNIRARASNGESYRNISMDYPVQEQTIRCIVERRLWKHIP